MRMACSVAAGVREAFEAQFIITHTSATESWLAAELWDSLAAV